MLVPDPVASRAVLVGVDAYSHPDLAPLPAAAAAAGRLATLFCDPEVWGLPAEHVTVLGADASQAVILGAVRDAGKAATDTMVVYFAGHGLRDRNEVLYLALSGADADYPEIGCLKYRDLRNVLRQTGYRARYRLTVLDCCYSGLAGAMNAHGVLSRAELGRALGEERFPEIGDWEDAGDLVLTSAPPTHRSFVPLGADYPEFTGELIDVLEHGISNAGPTLNVEHVWRRVRSRLDERGSPAPQQFAQNSVAQRIWFRNRANTLWAGPIQVSEATSPQTAPPILQPSWNHPGESVPSPLPWPVEEHTPPTWNGVASIPADPPHTGDAASGDTHDAPLSQVQYTEAEHASGPADSSPHPLIKGAVYLIGGPLYLIFVGVFNILSAAGNLWFYFWVMFWPVLAYTVPATITAGVQASPGAGIRNLIVYTTLGLLTLAAAFAILKISTEWHPYSWRGDQSINAGFAALAAGLAVPWFPVLNQRWHWVDLSHRQLSWVVDINQPWHWIADRLGVI